MKQYLTPEQTAKLIELGFEKPKTVVARKDYGVFFPIEEVRHYSIGELIEIMGYDLYSIHYKGLAWEVKSERVETRGAELIDALYDMCVKLKAEGVI